MVNTAEGCKPLETFGPKLAAILKHLLPKLGKATHFAAMPFADVLERRRFKTQAEARTAVFEFIEGFYNPRRRHSSIGYLSPIDYERHAANPDTHHSAAVLAAVSSRCRGLLPCTSHRTGRAGLASGSLDRSVRVATAVALTPVSSDLLT